MWGLGHSPPVQLKIRMQKKQKKENSDARDPGLIHGSGRSPGEGNDNLLQYACLRNPMDRGAWWAAVQGVAQSWTRRRTEHNFAVSLLHLHFHESQSIVTVWYSSTVVFIGRNAYKRTYTVQTHVVQRSTVYHSKVKRSKNTCHPSQLLRFMERRVFGDTWGITVQVGAHPSWVEAGGTGGCISWNAGACAAQVSYGEILLSAGVSACRGWGLRTTGC